MLKNVYNYISKHRNELVTHHNESIRPWGTYKVLEEDKNFKVKRIEVNTSAQLSLQLHEHRDEHWIIVEGEGEVMLMIKLLM